MNQPPPTAQHDSKLSTVRKLLAKAEDPGVTPAEAETYNAKAAELIAQYGIDRAQLTETDPGSDAIGDLVIPIDPPYAIDKSALLWQISAKLRCTAVRRRSVHPRSGARSFTMHVYGYGSDLQRPELLFTSLLVQAAHGMAAAAVPGWETTAAFRRSWLQGFTDAVSVRLAAAEERARDAAETQQPTNTRPVAVVLADRTALVQHAMEQAHPKTTTARTRSLSGSGGDDGYRAGQRADLGAPNLQRSDTTRPRLGPARADRPHSTLDRQD